MQDEVKVTTTEERGGWIQGGSEYQAKLGNEGGPQHSLAKLSMCIMYRWFKIWGVSITSEQKMRKEALQIVGDGYKAENVPFTLLSH